MPKQLLELKNFLGGITSNPSDTDIPGNNASYSENIDNLTTEGRLQGINRSQILDNDGFGSFSYQYGTLACRTNRINTLNMRGGISHYASLYKHVITWDGTTEATQFGTGTFNVNTITDDTAFLMGFSMEMNELPIGIGSTIEFIDNANDVQRLEVIGTMLLDETTNISGTGSDAGLFIIQVDPVTIRELGGSIISHASVNTSFYINNGELIFLAPGSLVQWTSKDQDFYIWFHDSQGGSGSEAGLDPYPNSLINNTKIPIGFKVSIDMRLAHSTSGMDIDDFGSPGASADTVISAITSAVGSSYSSYFTYTEGIGSGYSTAFQTLHGFVIKNTLLGNFPFSVSANFLSQATDSSGIITNIFTMSTFTDFENNAKTNLIYYNNSMNGFSVIDDIYSTVPDLYHFNNITSSKDINFSLGKNKIYFGTGNDSSSIPRVYSNINHERFDTSYDNSMINDSRNLAIDGDNGGNIELSMAGLSDIFTFPMYGIGPQGITDYDADNTWNNVESASFYSVQDDVFNDYDYNFTASGSNTLYYEFTNASGKLKNLLIGQIFKMASTQDTSDAALAEYKYFNYDDLDGATPTILAGDIFMYVGDADGGAPVVQYLGNIADNSEDADIDKSIPAFSFGFKKGTTFITRISMTKNTNDAAFNETGTKTVTGDTSNLTLTPLQKRRTDLNLVEHFDTLDETITCVAPCQIPLVNNNIGLRGAAGATHSTDMTPGSASEIYGNNGHPKVFYRHNVFWVSTIDTGGSMRLYRANLINYDNLALENDIQLESLTLNFGNIPTTLEAAMGSEEQYNLHGGNTRPQTGGIIPNLVGDDGPRKPSDHQPSWIRKPSDAHAECIGIVETQESGLIYGRNETVTDISTGDNLGNNGYVRLITVRYRSENGLNSDPPDQTRLTTGDKIRLVGIGDIDNNAKEDFVKAPPYTVRMINNNNFVIKYNTGHTFPANGFSTSSRPYWWTAKTWLLFKKPAGGENSSFKEWDLFLYNFNALDVTVNQQVSVADRTPPYHQAAYFTQDNEKIYYPRSFFGMRQQAQANGSGNNGFDEDNGYDDNSWAKTIPHAGSTSTNSNMVSNSLDLYDYNRARDYQVVNKAGLSLFNGTGTYEGIPSSYVNSGFGPRIGVIPLGENIGWVAGDNNTDINSRKIDPCQYTLHASNPFSSIYMGGNNRAFISYNDTSVSTQTESNGYRNRGVDIGHKVHFIGKTDGKFVQKPKDLFKLYGNNTSWIGIAQHVSKAPYVTLGFINRVCDEIDDHNHRWDGSGSSGMGRRDLKVGYLGSNSGDDEQWLIKTGNFVGSGLIDTGKPHVHCGEENIIDYDNEYVYYSIDDWSGHPGVVGLTIDDENENFGLIHGTPNFGGPEIETPFKVGLADSYDHTINTSDPHKAGHGEWQGYSGPNLTDPGDGYYIYINRSFASASFSENYNNTWQSWSATGPFSKFRWFNWSSTALRDCNLPQIDDTERDGDYVMGSETTSDNNKWNNKMGNIYDNTPGGWTRQLLNGTWYYHLPLISTSDDSGNVSGYLRPANANQRNRFDFYQPGWYLSGAYPNEHFDLYNDGFKQMGDIVTFRKLFFPAGYDMDRINGAKLFFHVNTKFKPEMRLLIYGSQNTTVDGQNDAIIITGTGGENAAQLMHLNDPSGSITIASGTPYAYPEGTAVGPTLMNDYPIRNGFPGSRYAMAAMLFGQEESDDNESSYWHNKVYFSWHNRSTAMGEIMGLSDSYSGTLSSGNANNPSNPYMKWLTDKAKFSSFIGGDLILFPTGPYHWDEDGDKDIGFATSSLDGDKYYLGGWKTSNEFVYYGNDNEGLLSSDDASTDVDDFIDSDMIFDATQVAGFIDVTDGTTITDGNQVFDSGVAVTYRVSLTYDGSEESILSVWKHIHTTSNHCNTLSIDINLLNSSLNSLNPRVSGLTLWRKKYNGSQYTKVKSLEFSLGNWTNFLDGNNNAGRKTAFVDEGQDKVGYTAFTGLDEEQRDPYVHYKKSIIANGRLYAIQCWHPEMENAETHVFRSELGSYSTFAWQDNNVDLQEIPIAIADFAGQIFIWCPSRLYRLDQDLNILDITEGVGIFGQNSFVVTEYGLFFADKNNIYLHDGSKLSPISGPILHNTANPGSNYGYQALAKQSLSLDVEPSVVFHGPTTSICVALAFAANQGKMYKFNLISKRWDLIDTIFPKSVTGSIDGDILISNELVLTNFIKDESTKYSSYKRETWRWDSKQFTMGTDTQDKVFRTIHLTGTPILSTMTGSSSDDLRVYIDDVQKTLTVRNKGYSLADIGLVGTSNTFSGSIFSIVSNEPFFVIDDTNNLNEFLKKGMYLQSSNSKEIVKVTKVIRGNFSFLGAELSRIDVDRAQLNTPEDWSSPDDSTIYVVSPKWKFPSGSKGKRFKLILANQKGHVDSIGITYKAKGLK